MPDRTINFGDDAADARYRIQDTSSTGGDLVLAEDLDGGTVLLEYDYSASEWVSRGPVNLDGNDITNAGSISASTLEADDGSSTSPSVGFSNEDGLGIYRASSGVVGVAGGLNTQSLSVAGSANFESGLAVNEGQSITDGTNNRLLIESVQTQLVDQNGNNRVEAVDGARVGFKASADTPARIYDEEGSFEAVKYITSSSSPGTLELTNAKLSKNPGGTSEPIDIRGDFSGSHFRVFTESASKPSSNGESVAIALKESQNFTTSYLFTSNSGELVAQDDEGNSTTLT